MEIWPVEPRFELNYFSSQVHAQSFHFFYVGVASAVFSYVGVASAVFSYVGVASAVACKQYLESCGAYKATHLSLLAAAYSIMDIWV